jgi:iron-sulfur cluster assembly protein
MTDLSISLTDRAVDHVKRYLAKQEKGMGLRLAVKSTGCSGYQYVVSLAEDSIDTDTVIHTQGVNIVIDKISLPFLSGTELDYIREGLNEGFSFKNPNVQETCGCGESFSLKTEANILGEQA